MDVTRVPAYEGPGLDEARQGKSEDDHHRAVFVWGGVRSRGGAMVTGLLQHARLHPGQALPQASALRTNGYKAPACLSREAISSLLVNE